MPTQTRSVVRRLVLWAAARRGGLDLTRLDRIPDQLGWPLHRVGVDPPARLASLRRTDPVHRLTRVMGMNVWLVTDYALAREVLADQSSYSTDIRPYLGDRGGAEGDIGGLGFTDPPDHTRGRALLTPEFTMRRLTRLRPSLDRIIADQLDEVARAGADGGPVDLLPTFALPLPFLMICELLGLPADRRDEFAAMGAARFDVSQGPTASLGAISGSREFLFAEVRRQRQHPGPGLIGQIIREHGDELGDYDLGGLADGVFTGGMETSVGMLALGSAVLLEHPQWWRRLGEPDAPVTAIVEELLRYLCVVQIAFPRFVLADVEVGGRQVSAGDVVLVSLPSASRDDVFAGDRGDFDPESFDPGRPARMHLAFGHGIHRCVGAELARLELRAAYPALAHRFPDMRLATTVLDTTAASLVYGVKSLLVDPGRDTTVRHPPDAA